MGANQTGEVGDPASCPMAELFRPARPGLRMVAGQNVALGRLNQHRTLTVTVSDTTLAIDLADGEVKVVRRINSQPVRSIKGQRPRIATSIS
jgi:hypothetical protein